MFATVEQRTAWELEQWTSKRTSPRKKVAAMAKPRRAHPVEQPAQTREVAAVSEPIKRVRMPRTVHPAVAARSARQVPAPAAPEPASPARVPQMDKRVIVLPDAVMTESVPAVKRPARAPKRVATRQAPSKKPEPEAPENEAAPRKIAPAPKKVAVSTPKPRRKAPRMALMPIEAPVQEKNGNRNGHAKDATGSGRALSDNGATHDATAEQTEILRELLRRVTAIEEKMTAQQPRPHRFRLRKR